MKTHQYTISAMLVMEVLTYPMLDSLVLGYSPNVSALCVVVLYVR